MVLLSVVDHYNRACKVSKSRAVGVLLGSWKKGGFLDVANSYAIPFEEDDKNPDVWFFDHDYLANMFSLFRKINAKEKVIGWYHTGPKLRPNDIQINELMRRFVPSPIVVIIDVEPKGEGLPTQAYVSVEEVHEDGTPTSKTFAHVSSEIGAEEAEEVGVEHLLRDIKNVSAAESLSQKVQRQLTSLQELGGRIVEIADYLDLVVAGKLPINHPIVYQLQEIFNLLPNLDDPAFVHAVSTKTSDQMLCVYIAALTRATIAFHNLISNKIENREAEQKQEAKDTSKDTAKPVVAKA